jgi:hypothetical protein
VKKYLLLAVFTSFHLFTSAQFYVNLTPYYHTHLVIIGDSAYFNRMDKMIQEKFDQELKYIDTAYYYLNQGDFESTEYWARKITSFEELYPDRYFLLTMSSAHMKKRSKFRMYYKKLKEYSSPEELRDAKKKLVEIGAIKSKKI